MLLSFRNRSVFARAMSCMPFLQINIMQCHNSVKLHLNKTVQTKDVSTSFVHALKYSPITCYLDF